MVFVFGIDIPIIEILLIISIATVVALFSIAYVFSRIVKSIKRLEELMERQDLGIERLEGGIEILEERLGIVKAKIEKALPKLAHLEKYIRAQITAGEKGAEIKKRLLDVGWEKKVINKLFKKIKE